jgi:hypothetical protein
MFFAISNGLVDCAPFVALELVWPNSEAVGASDEWEQGSADLFDPPIGAATIQLTVLLRRGEYRRSSVAPTKSVSRTTVAAVNSGTT